MWKQLWRDEAAFVISAELVLIATILVIGMIVGMSTIREQVVQELGDIALHLGQMNQSYSFSGVTGHHASTSGTASIDQSDDCDDLFLGDPQTDPPACIAMTGVDGVPE